MKGRDGKFYAVVAGKIDKTANPFWMWGTTATSSASVLTIDPQTYATTERTLAIEGLPMVSVGNGLYGCMACASATSDELFIKQEGYSATQIYRYDCQTGKTSVFATTSRSLAKYMTATPDGLLYVPRTDFYHGYTEVYRISDGTRMTGVESRIGKVAGDGGIVSTYSFAE
mgnify:FL=1